MSKSRMVGFFITILFISLLPLSLTVNRDIVIQASQKERDLINSGSEYFFPILIIIVSIMLYKFYSKMSAPLTA
jgi:hypothetical protein